jgi:peptidoglycan/xylan/chitin deacetylase (PgdA/CDA1 family)
MLALGAVLVLAGLAIVLIARGAGGPDPAGTAAAPRARAPEARTVRPAAERPAAPAVATGAFRGPVPILMYHVITAPKPGTTYPELWTPRETFRDTIALLRERGYRGVTLEQVRRAWAGGPGLPAKPVVVTFDDGYLSHATHAKPILRAARWPGVLYLTGRNLGPDGITSRQVRSMLAAGWELGAHSLTHPDLTTLAPGRLEQEVAGSRRLLQRRFDVPVKAFCYPAGRNDATVRAAVRDAGYADATTVEPGIASRRDDRFALPRIRVNGTDTPEQVLERVRTGAGAGGSGYG